MLAEHTTGWSCPQTLGAGECKRTALTDATPIQNIRPAPRRWSAVLACTYASTFNKRASARAQSA